MVKHWKDEAVVQELGKDHAQRAAKATVTYKDGKVEKWWLVIFITIEFYRIHTKFQVDHDLGEARRPLAHGHGYVGQDGMTEGVHSEQGTLELSVSFTK